MISSLGRQWIVDLFDCAPEPLKRAGEVEKILVEAARLIKATIVTTTFHEFSPFGVSGVVVIAESHLAIHTWPEHGYAAVDVFTCGDTLEPGPAAKYIAARFRAGRCDIREVRRGLLDGLGRGRAGAGLRPGIVIPSEEMVCR
jgi:S-adenosylmethionine decarboxylase proenzyme